MCLRVKSNLPALRGQTEDGREDRSGDVLADGYADGGRTTEFCDAPSVPDPHFEDHHNGYSRRGCWDGFNALEFDPGGRGLFSESER